VKWKEAKKCLFRSLRSETKWKNVYFVSLRSETKKLEAKWSETKKFWKRNKAKMRCIDFALVKIEKFVSKNSEMKRKKIFVFRMSVRNGSRFASFRFEAKNCLKRNRRTLAVRELCTKWLTPSNNNCPFNLRGLFIHYPNKNMPWCRLLAVESAAPHLCSRLLYWG
jgi:hypothetical protein